MYIRFLQSRICNDSWLLTCKLILQKGAEIMKEYIYIVVIIAITISLNVSIVYGESRIAYMLVGYLYSFITDVKSIQGRYWRQSILYCKRHYNNHSVVIMAFILKLQIISHLVYCLFMNISFMICDTCLISFANLNACFS